MSPGLAWIMGRLQAAATGPGPPQRSALGAEFNITLTSTLAGSPELDTRSWLGVKPGPGSRRGRRPGWDGAQEACGRQEGASLPGQDGKNRASSCPHRAIHSLGSQVEGPIPGGLRSARWESHQADSPGRGRGRAMRVTGGALQGCADRHTHLPVDTQEQMEVCTPLLTRVCHMHPGSLSSLPPAQLPGRPCCLLSLAWAALIPVSCPEARR